MKEKEKEEEIFLYEDSLVLKHIKESGREIIFSKELVISYQIYRNKKYGVMAYVEYDFGMRDIVHLEEKHNFLLNCKKHNDEFNEKCNIKEKIEKTISFDLFHAFFHVNEDPNYSHLHFALYGNLKDRVELKEDY